MVNEGQQARAAAAAERTDQAVRRDLLVLAIVGSALVVLGAVMAWLLGRGITTPLAEAVQVAEAVAQGRLDVPITVRSRDEYAQCCDQFDRHIFEAFVPDEQ